VEHEVLFTLPDHLCRKGHRAAGDDETAQSDFRAVRYLADDIGKVSDFIH
jgi:hypothetical protein